MRGGGGRSRPGRCLGGEGGRGGRDLPVGFCRSPIGCDAFGGEGGRARVRSYRGGGAVGGGICRLAFVGAHLGAMRWRGRRSRPSALLRGGEGRRGRDLPVGFCRSALGRDGLAGKAVAPECALTGAVGPSGAGSAGWFL